MFDCLKIGLAEPLRLAEKNATKRKVIAQFYTSCTCTSM